MSALNLPYHYLPTTYVRFDRCIALMAVLIFFSTSLLASSPEKQSLDYLTQIQATDSLPIANTVYFETVRQVNGPSAVSKDSMVLKPSVELSSEYSRLSNGYGNAHTEMLKYTHFGPIGVMDISATHQSRFGTQGTYLSIQLTRELNDRNYFRVSVGGGESILWPYWRTDYSIHHKFGTQKKYVAGVGVMYSSNRDNRSDRGLVLNLISYFDKLVLEGGLLYYRNNPGWVSAYTQYLAATWGTSKIQTLSLRAEKSQEAYQTTGDNFLVDFDSTNLSLVWRYWLSPGYSLILGARQYKNPFYKQDALKIGIEINFP
jgi:YaiO family outer membrane protein